MLLLEILVAVVLVILLVLSLIIYVVDVVASLSRVLALVRDTQRTHINVPALIH